MWTRFWSKQQVENVGLSSHIDVQTLDISSNTFYE